jgi:adenine deaminase
MELPHLLEVARGDAPGDLLLSGGRVVNVFSGEIERVDVVIAGGRVAGVGSGYRAREVVELDGAHVGPGLIDAHVHIESAMVPPREFAAAVLPHGVTTVIADPHEIANVLGLDGIRFMLREARACPLNIRFSAPSCVPPSPLATSGARLTSGDLAGLLGEPEILGLGELMDYPGVVGGAPALLDKIRCFRNRPRDGHCPGLDGEKLNAYVAAGAQSDHECTEAEEARRKLARGMRIFIREGSAARNLAALLPLVSPANQHRVCFCTDDRQLPNLIEEGSIDHMIRSAIVAGVDPVTAIRLGTINAAEHFGLDDRGAVAPGRVADLVVCRDLQDFVPDQVYAGGRLVAQRGKLLTTPQAAGNELAQTVNVDWARVNLELTAEGARLRTIGIVPGQLRTESVIEECATREGRAVSDPDRDLLKMAVIERHRASGNVGLGFVKGLGLRRGAIASTVAHDHHNLVVIGADDRSMLTAAWAVAEAGGGLAAADRESVLSVLPLPVAGLMSTHPAGQVADELRQVVRAAQDLGSTLRDPFATMSFLALEVIPSLKLTDRGLVDVRAMRLVPLFTDEW